jgi:ABC-type phosphate transport system substrate-binding protein
MRTISKKGMVVAVAGALTLGIFAPTMAHADLAPAAGDVVGVGSDTVQYIGDFGADGDYLGDSGYNAAGNVNRLVSFDATPDANARAGYLNGSTNTTLAPLNPTIVLRAGATPIQRPNGSGAGINALIADHAGNISYIRMSRPPTAAEQTSATGSTGVGVLRVVQLATDGLQTAVTAGTHAPTLSAQELVSIYSGAITTWNQLPGNSGGSTATIHPKIPQTGSGTRSSFLADLKTANGGTAPALNNPNIATVEENDPYSLYLSDSPSSTPDLDAIAPFSSGRLALYDPPGATPGFFHDPNVVYPGTTAALAPAVVLQSGTPGDTNPIYNDQRGLFVVFRNSDFTSTTPFQAGSVKNWVNTLFAATTGTPFFKGSGGAALIAAAGATPAYSDKGSGFSVG